MTDPTVVPLSTVQVGDNFRDEVAGLLRASGFDVETEILIGHKRVDLTFSEKKFGRLHRYIVEAKNWSVPLSKTALENIYGGYAALLNSSEADELLIVSQHQIRSAAAKAFLRDTPKVSHLSFNEFQESILAFEDYLRAYVGKHEANGLEEYYVSPLMKNGGNLVRHLQDWLTDNGADPLAIIAGYGMGKTSLAEHITYDLAKRFLSGESCRVPILTRLGMISREQSIEGLVGSVLAGRDPFVRRYSYPIFSRLNAIGRFLVLLDGFDEMKHMMTYSDFVANFDELNKLAEGAAKIILLGRPTAFISENERESVLRGTRPIGSTRVRQVGAPVYQEINLQPFTAEQLGDFIAAYLRRCQRIGGGNISIELLAKRQTEMQDANNRQLFSRPIHARMMADLAADSSLNFSQLSRYELYDHFVNLLIRRELAKAGRGNLYKANDRRLFAADLAWFLWTEHSANGLGCRIDDLPDHLFEPYLPTGEEIASAKRDLLSGSFLDEKSGGIFFFAHKSFQEFLVAEYIWDSIVDYKGNDEEFVSYIVEHITTEVLDFLIERNDKDFFRALMSALTECRSGLNVRTVRMLCRVDKMHDIAFRRNSAQFSTWDASVLIGRTLLLPLKEKPAELIRVARIVAEKSERKPSVILAAMNTLVVLGADLEVAADLIVVPLVMLLFARAELDLSELQSSQVGRRRGELVRDIMFEVVSARYDVERKVLLMKLDLDALLSELGLRTSIPASADNVRRGIWPAVEVSFDEFFRGLPVSSQRAVRKFYERDALVEGMIRD